MLFSIGDFVTFGSVLLILVVFRALDRNNRSLEKLKRFSDKIMENLTSFVEEKTTQIKDLSIELNVNLKTGKEILKRVREAEDSLTARSQNFDGIQKQLSEYDRSLSDLVSMSSRVDQNLARIRDESEFVEGVGKRVKDAAGQMERLEKEIPALREQLAEQGRQSVADAAAQALAAAELKAREIQDGVTEAERNVKDFSAFMARLEARMEETEKDRVAALARVLDGMEAELAGKRTLAIEETGAAAAALRKQTEAEITALGKGMETDLAMHRQSVDALAEAMDSRRAAVLQEARTALAGITGEAEQALARQRAMLEDAVNRGQTLEGEVFARLRQAIQSDEASIATVIEKIELRIQDHEGEVDYRLKKMEEVGADVASLEKTLRDSMAGTAAAVRKDLAGLASSLAEEWKAEIAGVQAERVSLQDSMGQLAQGLDELKARAYQDVSDKLRGFEEGFFADLRTRSAAMQERMQSWQAEVDKRIGDITLAYAMEREKLEKTYLEESRSSLEGLKKGTADELSRVDGQVSSLEEAVRERLSAAEEALAGLRETLRAETDKTRRDSAAAFDKELSAVRDAAEATTRKLQREIEARLKELSGELEAGRRQIMESQDASRTEMGSWQARLRQMLTEAETQASERIAALTADSKGAIGNIKDEFTAQKEDLIVSTNEERLALRNEIGELGEKLVSFQSELARTTGTAVEALHKELEAFELESQKRMRDVQTEVEGRIKEFKLLLAENREKAEALQEKMFGKVEEGSRLLTANLTDIDKRVKTFLAQTKLFERADTLRASLETGIEEMKKELTKLSGDKAEVAEIDAQLAKTRRLAEEVSGKLTRFLAEKRRIEDMDGEFKKILAVSREVDLKLDSLAASNDALQQIQAKIRQFEEMGRNVENGFERLERKQEIISVTSDGVDKNFQRLETLEKSIMGFGREAEGIAERLQGLKGEIETLSSAKGDSDAVRDAVGRLDGVLGDLEQRLEKAQSAREWLARTETRFEEIGKQAQEQVRLLESIIKAETRKDKTDRGAPPLDKRDTVIKLSHQGWSVQEISRVTQLSRGEVELILELAPKA
jgi:chromosome segregation ATPase